MHRLHVNCAALAVAAALSAALLVPAAGGASAKPGPVVVSCARLKRAALRSCRARNAANRAVYAKLRDARLVGARGDGAEVDWTFCANGAFSLETTSDGSTGVSRGKGWKVQNAIVRRGGTWFDAEVVDGDGLSIGVAMRGGRWKTAVYSLGSIDDLGDVVRSDARAACAAL
jgi:hypothetical protein